MKTVVTYQITRSLDFISSLRQSESITGLSVYNRRTSLDYSQTVCSLRVEEAARLDRFRLQPEKKHYTDALVFTEMLYFQPPDKLKK